MRKLVMLISALCVILASGCTPQDVEPEPVADTEKSEIVATVGGIDYTKERFNLYFYNAQDEILKEAGFRQASDIPDDFWSVNVGDTTMLDVAKEAAMELLIDDALEYLKASEFELKLTAEDHSGINNQMSALKQDKVSLAQFKYIGISVDEMEEYYKSEALMQELLIRLIDEGEITVDTDKVLEQFESSYVKVKRIYVATVDGVTGKEFSGDRVESAKKKAENISDRLNNGEDFDRIMNKESEDLYLYAFPLGYVFKKGELEPELEEVAFSLREEEISDPVTVSDGIYILKRIPFDLTLSQEIACLESIEAELAETHLEKLVKEWREETEIKIYDEALEDVEPSITNNRWFPPATK